MSTNEHQELVCAHFFSFSLSSAATTYYKPSSSLLHTSTFIFEPERASRARLGSFSVVFIATTNYKPSSLPSHTSTSIFSPNEHQELVWARFLLFLLSSAGPLLPPTVSPYLRHRAPKRAPRARLDSFLPSSAVTDCEPRQPLAACLGSHFCLLLLLSPVS